MKRALILALLLSSAPAGAFPTGSQFDLDPMMGDGAGGIVFDGAPRFAGHTCEVCHTSAEHRIGSRLEADAVELFQTGYTPGRQYHLRVILLDAHAAAAYQPDGDNCGFAVEPYRPCDQNGFALEVADLDGDPRGTFAAFTNGACATASAATDVDVHVMADGKAVTHNGAHHGQLEWDFCWTAPPAGTGLLTAYVSVVDGNGGDGTMAFPADMVGDDVTSGAVPLPEAGGSTSDAGSGGCAATHESGALLVVLVLALGLIARPRRARWLAALLALATAGGCLHVRPRQRETLARKNMKFAPDPVEDELDLHMQEAREGSSGGYGSSGGGCGCN